MSDEKIEVSEGLLSLLIKSMKPAPRVQILGARFSSGGAEAFDKDCLQVRSTYLQEGKTIEAARLLIERSWRLGCVGIPLPAFPKGFWSQAEPKIGDAPKPSKITEVMPIGELNGAQIVGSIGNLGDALKRRPKGWMRLSDEGR